MSLLTSFLRRLRALVLRRKLDREMAEEMQFHLDERADDHCADGLPPEEARYAARRKFGNVGLIQETSRDQRGWRWLEQLAQDLRYASRQLRRSPGFALTVIGILAFGIAATTAIFSIVHSVILKPLPYEQPGQLVRLFETP